MKCDEQGTLHLATETLLIQVCKCFNVKLFNINSLHLQFPPSVQFLPPTIKLLLTNQANKKNCFAPPKELFNAFISIHYFSPIPLSPAPVAERDV